MTLLQDLRYAARLLVNDRWFTAVAAVALALGIGLNTTVFTFVNAVLLRGLPFDRSDQILYVHTRNVVNHDDFGASHLDLEDWRQGRSFEGLAAFDENQMNVSETGRPAERIRGAFVSANAFRLLRQAPLLGRDFAPDEDRPEAAPVVIIGYSVWKNRYGSDPGILGHAIKIDDRAAEIIGVMPDGFRFPTQSDMWRPAVPSSTDGTRRDDRRFGVFGRLAPGVSAGQAGNELSGISARLQQQYPTTNKDLAAELMTFNERFNGGKIRTVFLALMGAVGFVLLIACANVANLLLARSSRRSREVGIRFALGASRARVVRQLLVESVLLSSLGGLLGLGLSYVGIALFDAAVSDVGKPYWIRFTMDYRVFGFMALVCLTTGLLFGLAPALQVSRTNVNEILKEGGRGAGGGARARRLTSVMVVAELTLTLVLLTGAGLMVRSFLKLYSMELGIDTSQVLTMRTTLTEGRYPSPEGRQRFYDALLTRLQSVPGLRAATLTSRLPLEGADSRIMEIEGRPAVDPKTGPRAGRLWVSPGYFDTLRVPVRRGRLFTETDGTPGAETAVVSDRFVERFFPGQDPLGQRFRPLAAPDQKDPNPWLTIVGIVPSVRQANPQAETIEALYYQPFRQRSFPSSALMIRADGSPATIAGAVREAVRAVDQDQPVYDLRTLDESLDQQRWPYQVFGSMFAIFAVVALVLSAVGIYAVTSYAVTQRTAEIGVRMALGAQPGQVSWLILRGGLGQLAIGLGLGLAGAFSLSSVMTALLVQTTATDPATFISITLLLSTVTVIACLIPARRATRLDPLKALNRG